MHSHKAIWLRHIQYKINYTGGNRRSKGHSNGMTKMNEEAIQPIINTGHSNI